MNNTLAVLVAVLLAGVAMAVGAYSLSQRRAEAAAAAELHQADGSALDARVAALEGRMDELVRLLGELRLEAREVPTSQRVQIEAIEPDIEAERITERIESIERELAERPAERANTPVIALDELLRRRADQHTEAELDELVFEGNDPLSSPAEKLAALASLRGERFDDGTDARLPVVGSMIQLAQSSDDGELRADVWRHLSGVDAPELLFPLLDALANDEYERAREEAAETLADFLPNAEVEAALRAAIESDPSDSVRRQASRSLDDDR